MEQAVIDECAKLENSDQRPGTVSQARVLAGMMDDPKMIRDWPSVSRQLTSLMDKLRIGALKKQTNGQTPVPERQYFEAPDLGDEDALAHIAFDAYQNATGYPAEWVVKGWRAAAAAVKTAALLQQADRATAET
jgi:hypothetical protein